MQGKILSKAPCNEDLFEGGAHKKLAKVIADEIQKDSNCTIIGIDGGWGAGKSNLVGMVENVLANATQTDFPSKYHFFNYDAWGHQNDLPRRAILEELTSEITSGETPILESQDWKIRLENLLAKKKRTSTKIVPRLNFALITIALMTALTPVVGAISDKIPTPEGKILFTGLIYAAFILFVIIKQLYNMRKNGQPINVENFFTELFLLYKDKIKEDEKFETISEREPSTKQFKDWMFDINKDLYDRGKILSQPSKSYLTSVIQCNTPLNPLSNLQFFVSSRCKTCRFYDYKASQYSIIIQQSIRHAEPIAPTLQTGRQNRLGKIRHSLRFSVLSE